MSATARPYTERDGSEIVTYDGFGVEYRDASHRYWIHAEDKRHPVASVTGVLKVLDKPALLGWAEGCGARGAAQLAAMGELKDVPLEDVPGLVRLHKLGMDATRDAGADRGTAIHNVLEQYCTAGTLPKPSEFTPQVRGYVQGLCGWLLKAKPEPILMETIVGSFRHLYAGRLDLIAMVNGRRTLVDLKTNPKARVYPEAHLQAVAYDLAAEECGIEPTEVQIVVGVGETGEFTETQCRADTADWLAVLDCQRALARVRASISAAEKIAKAA